ncbi:hypothetical protein PV08_00499 [Exophiala spinifera]|uniref:Uncharacterized protein n=1 Tax=Exophiala spinifera TaxID=91928 RepID=A0A0D2C8Q5_9EURO|nr:uncharacterized protein PV08_00499 [Exophiala spinifera]KIW19924.1 hypothetical protein PV08_00499 [Exophiala spinifera]
MPIRLIDTTTLRMKVFLGAKIPAYAILSHTWVEDEEVDFLEMNAILRDPQHPATDKSGYEKIRATCREAKRHGISYAWVDTCSIDKSSSAELTEAINSMFAWYRNAEVCFVFLSDVGPDSNILTTLQHCRWMTRGWTLQELIAPRDLRFYNSAWEHVGSKMSLKQQIRDTTAINDEVLEDCDALQDVPVARRMAWASRRETTRVEDIAYCLLGIFDVNMPLLYGEGDKAFIRLQEEIIRRSDDLSIFCNLPGFESLDQPPRPSTGTGDTRCLERYQDLFATSPKDFSVCYDISRGEWSGLIHTFSSTNVGVRFENVRIHVAHTVSNLERRSFYILPLGHMSPHISCTLLLEKIGPKYFVRRNHFSATNQLRFEMTWAMPGEPQDLHIVSKLTPAIYRQIHSVNRYGIEIKIRGNTRGPALSHERLYGTIEKAMPEDSWDAIGERFLVTMSAFRGYVKVRTGAANKIRDGVRVSYQQWFLGLKQDSRLGRTNFRGPLLKFLQFPDLAQEDEEQVAWDAMQEYGFDYAPCQLFLQALDAVLQARVERVQEVGDTRFRVVVDCDYASSRSQRRFK